MNEIQLFSNAEFGDVRIFIDDEGNPMFNAKDVCSILDIAPTAASRLDDDEKGLRLTQTPGGEQSLLFVTEPGFYKLVMRSRKPEAKAFQRWVTHEVLPALRRDGAYVASDGTEDDDVLMARALFAADKAIKRKDARIAKLTAENKALANKAAAFDEWVDETDGLVSLRKAGKLMKSLDKTMGEKKLRALLREHGYIEKKSLSCTVKAIEPGYMKERVCDFYDNDGHKLHKSYGCLTTKGLAMCAERYCNQTSLAVE